MGFLRFLLNIRSPFLDQLMLLISYIATPFVVCAVIAWYYLNVDKDDACAMSFGFCFSCLLCQAVKIVVRAPRPWNIDTQFTPVESAMSSATGYSFPSIHSQSSASLMTSFFYKYKNKLVRILCVIFLALSLFSRMYLGCHTPQDVLVGALAGVAITAFIWFLWNMNKHEGRGAGNFCFFLLAFAAVSVFLTTSLLLNGTIDYANASDSYKTAGMAVGFAMAFLLEPHFLRFSVEGSPMQKLLRFMIALGGVALINFGMKLIPTSSSIPLLLVRYALLILWMLFFTPLICLRCGLHRREEVPLRMPEI